jgi:hypothetical protein
VPVSERIEMVGEEVSVPLAGVVEKFVTTDKPPV